MIAPGLPHPGLDERPKVAVHRPPRRKGGRRRQVTPWAPSSDDVPQAVEPLPHVCRGRPAARLRRRDQRFEYTELIIAQGLAAAKVSHQSAVLGCPHRRLPSKRLSPPLPQHPPRRSLTAPTRPPPDFSNGVSARLWPFGIDCP